jgi:protein TonB
MKFLLTTAFFLSVLSCSAQDTARKPIQDTARNPIFTKVEIESCFIGGPAAWNRFLNKNLRYPRDARNDNIEGTVIVQFIVDREGKVSDIRAISGPETGGLREEAVRLIDISRGGWVPAIQNGRQVQSYKRVPIMFKLD